MWNRLFVHINLHKSVQTGVGWLNCIILAITDDLFFPLLAPQCIWQKGSEEDEDDSLGCCNIYDLFAVTDSDCTVNW